MDGWVGGKVAGWMQTHAWIEEGMDAIMFGVSVLTSSKLEALSCAFGILVL